MLRFGKVVVGGRTELERLEAERDHWEARAHALSAQLSMERSEKIAKKKGDPPRKAPLWHATLVCVWVLMFGVFIGGAVVPHAAGPTVLPDYEGCIVQSRFDHPIAENQYQELVNALWNCDVFEAQS